MMIYNTNCISTIEGEWYYNFEMMNADGVARCTFINLICFNGIFPLRVPVIGRKLIYIKKRLSLPLLSSQKTQSLTIRQHHYKYSNTNILLLSGNLRLWWWNAHCWMRSFINSKEKEKCDVSPLKRLILFN